MKYLLFLTLPLYVLDQISKALVLQHVTPEEPRIVVPDFFALVFVTNDGAAFGSFKDNNSFFMILSGIAIVVVLTLLFRKHERDTFRDVSLTLLLAGVLGNLTDRILHGAVIDFLLFNLHVPFADPWPAFNVADACICIAVGFFMVHSFRAEKKPAHEEEPA